jgi:3-phosphoshikimate 1-carboxyvinyltransferase
MSEITLLAPSKPITASVAVPGSKSYTNRALLMAALASGTSRLTSVSTSTDCEAMIRALKTLGVSVSQPDASTIVVEGCGGSFKQVKATIDVGPAGTTMRFLAALCAAIPGIDVTLRGSERMHMRPIGDLVNAARQAGAAIDYLVNNNCPPLRVHSNCPLKGRGISLNGSTSSQFISALLLTSPLFLDGLDVIIEGTQISTSYIDMTIQSLADFGVEVSHDNYQRFYVSSGQRFHARDYHVEGDASGASYLWALAAVSGGTITVKNVNPASAQGDIKFPSLLERMGCSIRAGDRSITVSGTQNLRAIDADMTLMPDTAQTLAAVAACAEGTTVLRGLSTLKVKETDRIEAVRTELSKMGIHADTGPDYIAVHGGTPKPARIATYDDHRMAMSFAILVGRIGIIQILDPKVVEKSFPDFWPTLAFLGIRSEGK